MSDLLPLALPAALMAIACWWLGTGAVLWLVRRSPRGMMIGTVVLTVLLAPALGVAAWSMGQTGVAASYAAFASVIVMWSWHELAFLSGWITGPRRIAQDPAARGWRRFGLALQALLHHEMALLANFGLLVMLQRGQPGHVALCTFALLWCMRVSAKLNLFFGVPHVGDQYLPARLAYLGSYFRRSPVTPCYHLTMLLSVAVWLWLVLLAPRHAAGVSAGWVMLGTLLTLAILEHVLMAHALPVQALWSLFMRASGMRTPVAADPLLPAATLPAGRDGG